ncbi:MAG: DUF1295 domain-containing protein, partial [Gemmatimonadetes bacterium]|nr:DUF1295 domain-containing protein [Gemmatimonadota bacterium]
MISLFAILALNLGLACTLMVAVWMVSIRLRDASIIDIAWGAAGALLAVSTFIMADGDPSRKLLVTGM